MDLKNIDIKNNDKFAHLHVHSHFSILDGLSSPKDLVKYAKEQGFKALALTDHGTVGGLYRFQKECNANGIKPILGMEGYISKDHNIKDKEVEIFHILLLVKNAIGLKNLMKLATIAELEGKYRKPRIDFELLKKYHEGLICTSACPSSELSELLNNNQIDDAKALILKFKDLFGEDYYIEMMKHEYFDGRDQQEVEKRLCIQSYALAKEMNVKIIVTNDVHYAKPDDWKFHDILLSMQTKNVIKNPKRFSFGSKDFYMKSYDEMIELFKGMEDAVTNTLEIVNKIESTTLLNPSKDLLPSFNLPEGFKSEEDYLKALVKDGMISKGFINNEIYRERIKFEMNVIIKCGYTKYFLILWDVISWARANSISIGIGRGCFLSGNKVQCKNELKDIQDVRIGDYVLAYDGKYHKVINTLNYDVNEEIIDIEIEDGRKISCTLDHKIHVKRDNELVWIKACELNENDDVYDINMDN